MKIDKIYLDMDGVIADFDAHFENLYGMVSREYEDKFSTYRFWEKVYETPNFFSTMPVTPWFWTLFELCKSVKVPIVILSSPSRVNTPLCMIEKRKWVDSYLGGTFPAIFEKEKHKYAGEGRLLIDDQKDKCDKWTQAGGIAHQFTTIELFTKFICEVLSGNR